MHRRVESASEMMSQFSLRIYGALLAAAVIASSLAKAKEIPLLAQVAYHPEYYRHSFDKVNVSAGTCEFVILYISFVLLNK